MPKKNKTDRKRKTVLMDIAKKHGFQSEKPFLEYLISKHGGRKNAAEAVSITYDWFNKCCQKNGIESLQSRKIYSQKIEKFNIEHNTNYIRTLQIIEHLSGMGKTHKEIADALAITAKTVCNAIGPEKKKYKVKEPSTNQFHEERPSNLTEAWTNPKIAPCSECIHHKEGRSKYEPGCVKCPRRLEYVALIEAGNRPGVTEHGQAGVYWGARGHALNVYDWGFKI